MTSHTNDEKVSQVISRIMKLINKSKLTVPELLLMYGNVGYHIGASIAGLKETGPSIEQLKKEYYSNPTVDVGLMIQGLMITDWEQDYIKHPRLSKLGDNKK